MFKQFSSRCLLPINTSNRNNIANGNSYNCNLLIENLLVTHFAMWTHIKHLTGSTLFISYFLPLLSTTLTELCFGFAFPILLSRDPFRCFPEVANGFGCPAPGEVSNAGSFSRHAHPEDCRKYYICLEGVAREYGCPIGTVFKIGDADGTGNCEDPEDVPGWWVP